MQNDHTDIRSMLATLCFYEDRFGPYHPQTLNLTALLAMRHWKTRDIRQAGLLLERVVRDAGRHLGREHDVRLQAMDALREIFLVQCEYERAAAVQNEILQCQIRRRGPGHPDTCATRAELAAILLDTMDCNSAKEA